MVFSSAVFLFAFLPIVFILHTAIRNTTARNILLIVASLLFYAWGEPAYILLLLLSILVNFVLGRFVWGRKPVLALSLIHIFISASVLDKSVTTVTSASSIALKSPMCST